MCLGVAYFVFILLELLESVDVLFSSDSENLSHYFFEYIFLSSRSSWDPSYRCVGCVSGNCRTGRRGSVLLCFVLVRFKLCFGLGRFRRRAPDFFLLNV